MKLALAILSFKRYEHLRLTLETVKRNIWLDKIDCWLFQDNAQSWITGRWYAVQEDVLRCLDVFGLAELPSAEVYLQPCNIGPIVQTCDVFEQLFKRGYDFVMLIPNDLALGKFYVHTVATLAEQYGRLLDVGLIHTLPAKAKDLTIGELKAFRCELSNRMAPGSPEAEGGRIDQGMWRRTWDIIGPDVVRFKSLAIQQDFVDLIVPASAESEELVAELESEFGTVQADLAIPMIAESKGLGALHTASPRACHFGGEGCYSLAEQKRLDLAHLNWCSKEFWLWDIGNVDRYYMVQDG